jgi:hypothetical protein
VPNGWTPDQIRQFQDYWDTEFSGDLAKRRRAKFVPGKSAARVVQTKEPEHKDEFDEGLAAGKPMEDDGRRASNGPAARLS